MIPDPERVPEIWHPFRVRTEARCVPVVCAALRPPATIWQPFRLRPDPLRAKGTDQATNYDPNSSLINCERIPIASATSSSVLKK